MTLSPGAPLIRPFGPPSPRWGEGKIGDRSELPLLPVGRRSRRADEGAPGVAVKIIKQDIRKHRSEKTAQARQLRQNETEEEYHLWSDLRARRLNGYKFTRQVPLGPYIVDFLCRDHNLVVEVDGSQHAESAYDQRRTDWLNAQGYSVLRFWNNEVSRQRRSVLETILAALTGRLEADPASGFYIPASFTKKNKEQQP